MENVIYSKFSSERKKQFQIVTKIIEENNKRYIKKQALSKEGYAHIGTLIEKRDRLINSKSYRNVFIVGSELKNEGTAELEYIYGRTFEEVINDRAKHGNTDELINTIKDFFNLFEIKTKFKCSEGFRKIFGDIEIKENYLCMDVSNIDLLFSNVILNDNKYYISDYEWVFDFEIPFKYIVFRSIAFNTAISKLGKDNIDKIYGSFDISKEEIDIFYKMEVSFQNYVSGIKVLEDYKRKSENVVLPVNAINIRKNVYSIQLLSNGIVIETKHFYKREFLAEFCIDSIKDDINVRFGNVQSIIKIEKIIAYRNGQAYTPQYTVNDAFHINENYYFKNERPEVYIINEGMEKLEVKVIMYYTNTGLVGEYIDKIFEVNEINSKLNEINNSLIMEKADKEELMKINNSYQQEIKYLHSKGWFKLYFKLKAMRDKILRR